MGTGAIVTRAESERRGRAAAIGGLSALKGLVLYGAVLTFAGLHIYFIVRISGASSHPRIDGTLVTTAAALAGVLGSAFALEIGTPTETAATNRRLRHAADTADNRKQRAVTRIWQGLSLEPKQVDSASWPKTFGIWVYAVIAFAVAVTYVLNQDSTPPAIRALAISFGGYVVALVNAAYRNGG
jgi:hypothetical protein